MICNCKPSLFKQMVHIPEAGSEMEKMNFKTSILRFKHKPDTGLNTSNER